MPILQNQERIGKYRVCSLIKSNIFTETYRVEDADGMPYFLKLFILKNVPQSLVDSATQQVREIQYCSALSHKNVLTFVESGEWQHSEGACQYYVTSYLTGAILSDKIARMGTIAEDEAIAIYRGILSGLQYLHSLSPALCHNDLDPSNVMLTDVQGSEVQLIDFGHLSERCSGAVDFTTSDLDLYYHADETMVGIFDEQGDIFSATSVLYAMLTGQAPWKEATTDEQADYKSRMGELKQYRKSHPLDIDSLSVSDKTKFVLRRGMEPKNINRFSTVDEILRLLDSEEQQPDERKPQEGKPSSSMQGQKMMADSPNYVEFNVKRGEGNGFKDIAGMQELKTSLQKQVIFVIKNKEIAQQYRLSPPNGMLLYGPPGCGKTFFAEKFAEETGFNYILVKSSDLASSYIHGTQEKINQLFVTAEQNAPIVVCFDEFDALVPDRSMTGESSSKEVNEFLTQMNNCSKRGIFIVATSNRPDKIDPAVLRTGRVDKSVYVPLPDFEARKEMFALHLKDRPMEDDISVDQLAKLTDGYIASDIAYIVNDAAMVAAYERKKISQSLLEESVKNTHPSIRPDSLKVYEEIRQKMESTNKNNVNDRVRIIGYH